MSALNFSNTVLEVLVMAGWQENEIKGFADYKRIKLSLFVDAWSWM